jgi:hypothetical protein
MLVRQVVSNNSNGTRELNESLVHRGQSGTVGEEGLIFGPLSAV